MSGNNELKNGWINTWKSLVLAVLLVASFLTFGSGTAFAGTNTWSAFTSQAGPLSADGSQQTVATVTSTASGGGATTTDFTVTLGGTIGAGDVSGVYVTGAFTWSITGSFGTGPVVCTGAGAKPGNGTYSINVTLNGSAAGKTVSVQLNSETNNGTSAGLPLGPSTALSISAPPALNSYGTIASGAGPLTADLSQQLVATVPVTTQSGGLTVSTYTVNLSGTVTAGDVAGVYVSDGTSTWSATGSYGNGSSVVCSGANAIPGATLSIRVTLNATADTKTVAVTLNTDSNTAATLPKGPSTALSISAPAGPANTLSDCGSCHNYPPVDAGSRDALTGNFIGDHDLHSSYTCATCHVAPADTTSLYFAHRSGTLNMDDGNIGVGLDTGTYSKGTGFNQVNSPTGGTCATVDCHYSTVTPQWGLGVTACNSCHTLPPTSGAHTAHYTAKGWGADSTYCTVCHPLNSKGSHSDVTDASVTVNPGLNYAGGGGSCSSPGALGCHNNHATPTWVAGNAVCTDCHTAGGANPADPMSGLHAATNLTDHDGTLSGGTGNPCEKCHTTAPSTSHYDTVVDTPTVWNLTNIPGGYVSGTDSCTASCHSDSGTWNRRWDYAKINDVTWAYANNAATTAVCGNCHGSFFTGWNIVGATSHDNPSVANDPTTLTDVKGSHSECSTCHAWGHTNYSTGTKHKNGTLEMNSTLDSTPGDGDCTTNCHTGNTYVFPDPISGWTDASVVGDGVTCGGCHTGGVTPSTASGAHDKHGATFASVAANPASIALCIECHGNDGTGATHNNGTVNFVGASYSTAVRNNLTGTCSTSSCHNQGADPSAAWNAVSLACNDCHYYEASPLAANNSAHAAPLSATHGDHFNAGKVCTQCHGTLPTDTTHINGGTSANSDKATALQDEATLAWTDASAVTDYTFTDVSNTCSGATNSGLGCHATGAPVWDTPFASTDCTNCHTDTSTAAVNPSSGLHGLVPSITAEQHDSSFAGGSGNCSSCHTTIPAAGTHKDGTFQGGNGQVAQMGLAAFYTQTADNTGTCATTTCHLGNSDAWAHKWMATANYTNTTAACTGCHGNFASGFNAGVDHLVGGIAGIHQDDATANNYGCETCHALQASTNNYPFTFGTADWAPLNAGNKHGNNLITMNDDVAGAGGTVTGWQRGTGGNSAKSMCLKCHTNWTDSAPQHWFTNTTWTTEEIVGDGVSAGHGVGANCSSCHDGSTQGTRRDVGLDFNQTYQHGSINPVPATNCVMCHEEVSGPDTTIDLKVWDAAGTGYTTVAYNPADLSSANTSCLSCHDATRNVQIEGLSPPARSMVNFTSASTYNNHNFNLATGAVVPQKAKAISPHGNPNGNVLKGTDSGVTTSLGCLHCHPSHGSATASKAATGDAAGNAVSARMLGGFPSSKAGVGYDYTNEGSLSDPDLCWGCHDLVGVADYYGDTTTGHWDGGTWKSPTFAYKTGKGGVVTRHIANKVDGGTADDATANIVCTTCHDVHGSPTVAQFYSPALKGKWLTSPYYEDRASQSKTSVNTFAWANANSAARSAADANSPRAAIQTGTGWAPKEIGGGYGIVGTQNGAWGWFIDGNTFGMSAYQPYTSGAVTQKHMSDYDATAANITTFGGLCMTACHSAVNIEARTTWTGHNPVVPGFGGTDTATDLFNVNGTTNPSTTAKVRNQMVGQGWYNDTGWGQNLFATNTGERQGGDAGAFDAKTYSHSKAFSYGVNPITAGAQASFHQFPCSKCHNPHASELPALMRTNCLNTSHSSYEYRMSAEANNCHRVEDSGAPYIGAGDPYPGTGYPATHGTTTSGGWNVVTPW